MFSIYTVFLVVNTNQQLGKSSNRAERGWILTIWLCFSVQRVGDYLRLHPLQQSLPLVPGDLCPLHRPVLYKVLITPPRTEVFMEFDSHLLCCFRNINVCKINTVKYLVQMLHIEDKGYIYETKITMGTSDSSYFSFWVDFHFQH